MTTLRNEFAGQINGVDGRFHNVILWPEGDKRHSGRIANQQFGTEARDCSKEYGKDMYISATVRFDDNCKNGHETFSITGEIKKRGHREPEICGCIHEELAKYFPELAPLIKWHLTSSDGPMHYVANTVYHASNLGTDGLPAGMPTNFKTLVFIGSSPVPYGLKGKFMQFLEGALADGKKFEPVPVAHKKTSASNYDFEPKYTVTGYPCEWYECPFDEKPEALAWCQALNAGLVRFEGIATSVSKGKERDFKAARSCAAWPEITDEELSLPKAELTALLEARLPSLIHEFKNDMLAVGFLWVGE
jgi:hypothetical protein